MGSNPGCVVVQLLIHVQLFATPWTAASQASMSITVSQRLLKLISIESVMPSTTSSSVTHLSSSPQSFLASGYFPLSWLFTSGGQSINQSFSISPSSEYLGPTSFKIDWFDLLAVQGTLKSLLQDHNSKASIFQHSVFFFFF